jgi:cardiolipin synthase|tara:strand:+ start:4504 stop:5070 length:567 start_codon:yes stop_codon:yes gene_type:complete
VWTVPNAISVARIACIPWFVWLLFAAENRTAAALLLGALGATDWVDGWIARRFDQISEVGKVLDPTADRFLLLVAAPAMIIDGSVPTWFAVAALLREVLIGVAALVLAGFGARRIDVTWWGKTGTFALLFAFPCFLAGESTIIGRPAFAIAAWIFAIPGLLISWWAGLGYVPEGLRALREGRAARNGA